MGRSKVNLRRLPSLLHRKYRVCPSRQVCLNHLVFPSRRVCRSSLGQGASPLPQITPGKWAWLGSDVVPLSPKPRSIEAALGPQSRSEQSGGWTFCWLPRSGLITYWRMARIWSVMLVGLLATGCASKPGSGPKAPQPAAALGSPALTPPAATASVVAPGGPLSGRVASVNPTARFVVLSFPLGALPAPERQLSVYRAGLKVGELKVTRWQMDNLVVADILAGECREGDEAREE